MAAVKALVDWNYASMPKHKESMVLQRSLTNASQRSCLEDFAPVQQTRWQLPSQPLDWIIKLYGMEDFPSAPASRSPVTTEAGWHYPIEHRSGRAVSKAVQQPGFFLFHIVFSANHLGSLIPSTWGWHHEFLPLHLPLFHS
eukprot:TRINITY_DN32301_c0_g1_i1.p1 TRINITY_DN32301_c0_g1~~TRINITY_DN32301_c0_g1_i1.p1  ORF type:complete len:141 (-),score=25.50 TRINITY_DN32301_c0_g1_i1:171-593(-)